MKKEEFIIELQEIMEIDDDIEENMQLKDIAEWDSLARLTFMSFLDSEFGINVTSDEVKESTNVADLLAFAKLID